jgi:hypothetical protein
MHGEPTAALLVLHFIGGFATRLLILPKDMLRAIRSRSNTLITRVYVTP